VNVYAGRIRHRRFAVRAHAFRHRIALAYFDVADPRRGGRLVRFAREERLRHVVAEVTNTSWGERHAYVMPAGGGRMDKVLHVSPFMAMDHEYTLRAGVPGETLSVHVESRRGGRLAFDATLGLRRRPFSRRPLLGASLRTLALIYAHALVLKTKGVPVRPHPEAA
jgi:DUF1365 family protein